MRKKTSGRYAQVILGLAALAAAFIILPAPESCRAASREELSKILQMLPPDGLPARYGNVAMRNRSTKKGKDPVIFPHWLHRAKYTCRVCHLELDFSMPRGGTGITRGGNLAGRHCGACHDGRIAFSVRQEDKACDRCHIADPKTLDRRFKEFAEKMPRYNYGDTIDWEAAIEEGLIEPKNSLYEADTVMHLPEALETTFKLKSGSRAETLFSHKKHVLWLDCANCHPDIFNIKKQGTESFSMDKNLYGWFCGTCHLRVSFSMTACNRCHPGIRSGVTGPRF